MPGLEEPSSRQSSPAHSYRGFFAVPDLLRARAYVQPSLRNPAMEMGPAAQIQQRLLGQDIWQNEPLQTRVGSNLRQRIGSRASRCSVSSSTHLSGRLGVWRWKPGAMSFIAAKHTGPSVDALRIASKEAKYAPGVQCTDPRHTSASAWGIVTS